MLPSWTKHMRQPHNFIAPPSPVERAAPQLSCLTEGIWRHTRHVLRGTRLLIQLKEVPAHSKHGHTSSRLLNKPTLRRLRAFTRQVAQLIHKGQRQLASQPTHLQDTYGHANTLTTHCPPCANTHLPLLDSVDHPASLQGSLLGALPSSQPPVCQVLTYWPTHQLTGHPRRWACHQ